MRLRLSSYYRGSTLEIFCTNDGDQLYMWICVTDHMGINERVHLGTRDSTLTSSTAQLRASIYTHSLVGDTSAPSTPDCTLCVLAIAHKI